MFLDNTPELQAHILVHDQPLAEYDDEDTVPTNTRKTKFVEAEEGCSFAVRVVTQPQLARSPDDCVSFQVYVDGKPVGGKIIETGNKYAMQSAFKKGLERNTATGSTEEEFRFTHLRTSKSHYDGPVGKAKHADFKHLGEIRVCCFWARKVGHADEQKHLPDACLATAAKVAVPEKCLKGRAISSRTTLGPAKQRAFKIHYIKTVDIYGSEPFATFTFKYRSRRDLQIEGIVPRSPSPVPLEERDPQSLTLDESRELVRRMRQREKEQRIEIKKEGQAKPAKRARSQTVEAGGDDGTVVVLGEGPARKRGRQSPDSGVEIVDLTDD
ncbi:hypothetical protein CERZMDRAFT_94502 [Cercospora zeae-maydis SCOH1-5]|uniref:DUF7918 domain-containing protein n=1 Tax=Cercospora zeae-maydis SCOH1-5 TaxID=717836 RepID=A0A6A6FNV8_9PEZI|nr:hypothetical protein CERZMDRAFT_94502 [Cercospora zeae-maydis SCOH1-5]